MRWEGFRLPPPSLPSPADAPPSCRHLSVAGSHPGPRPLLVPAGCCPLPDAFLGCGWHPPGSAAARTHLLSIITMQLKQRPQRTLSCPRGAEGRQIPPLPLDHGQLPAVPTPLFGGGGLSGEGILGGTGNLAAGQRDHHALQRGAGAGLPALSGSKGHGPGCGI